MQERQDQPRPVAPASEWGDARHPFVPSGDVHVATDGRRLLICATCGKLKIGQTHTPRGERAPSPERPPRPEREPRVAIEPHEFNEGLEVALDKRGYRLRLCRPPCGAPANAPQHRGYGAHKRGYVPKSQRAPVAPPVPVPTWEAHLLAHAIDVALDLPTSGLSWRVRTRLILVRQALAEDFPGLVVGEKPIDSIMQTAAEIIDLPSRTRTRRAPEAPPPSTVPNPIRATRKLRRGIRNDRVRALFDRATAQGWLGRTLGSGHIEMRGPDGARLVISETSNGMGRGWDNARAQAKRLGIDTAGL